MKILFIGDFSSNAGPANVNKRLAEHFSGRYLRIRSKNNILKMLELGIKLWICPVVILSAITRIGMITLKLANIMGKKTVYLMHGCLAYEAALNESYSKTQTMVKEEQELLEKADLILPVSRRFSSWVKERYPQYANKTAWLYNGVDTPAPETGARERIKGSIIAAGGDRGTKNNAPVADAVEELGGAAQLTVCGRIYSAGFENERQYTRYVNLISQEEFAEKLRSSELFVLNSLFEPFSLSVMDALNCGCSVLVSQYAGIADLLDLTGQDTIMDPMDREELKQKIRYLLENPNNARLRENLDYDRLSHRHRAEQLTAMCENLLSNRM